ncbi:MAG TPA: polyprenol monophosphomannose synthase [Acidimicrobiales bacterium]|nr:polyprenol monophosphomannose synthase [Acidimicrobiales bacterium]
MGTLPRSFGQGAQGSAAPRPSDALPLETGTEAAGTLVILPTYREADNIVQAIERVRRSVPGAAILVVDDDGGDGTAELAQEAGRRLGAVEVLRRPGKAGLASAYRSGLTWALDHGFDVIVGMDADLSHDATALPRLLSVLAEGADVVVGSRYVRGGSSVAWPLGRRALSRWGNWYAAHLLGSHVGDLTSAFRVYRASVLRGVDFGAIRAGGYGFLIELAYMLERSGARFAEVPVQFINRVAGRSKMSLRIALESLRVVTAMGLTARWERWRGRRPT